MQDNGLGTTGHNGKPRQNHGPLHVGVLFEMDQIVSRHARHDAKNQYMDCHVGQVRRILGFFPQLHCLMSLGNDLAGKVHQGDRCSHNGRHRTPIRGGTFPFGPMHELLDQNIYLVFNGQVFLNFGLFLLSLVPQCLCRGIIGRGPFIITLSLGIPQIRHVQQIRRGRIVFCRFLFQHVGHHGLHGFVMSQLLGGGPFLMNFHGIGRRTLLEGRRPTHRGTEGGQNFPSADPIVDLSLLQDCVGFIFILFQGGNILQQGQTFLVVHLGPCRMFGRIDRFHLGQFFQIIPPMPQSTGPGRIPIGRGAF
mmetsp:Transcript_11233/g.21418  ORF Transcript_11233/g.21418 Transcript_11233/m.21418 type:complete len:307 (+) Transcript_11233:931-1851(+)